MDRHPTPLVVTAGALLALVGSFVAGATWSGSGPEAPPDDGGRRTVAAPPRQPVAPLTGPGLTRAASCDQLLAHYVDEALDRVGPWGWEGHLDVLPIAQSDGGVVDLGSADRVTSSAPAGADEREVASGPTGTNVQEAEVDESDVVKTDGSLLVRLDGDDLTTYDVSGAEVRELSRLDLPGGSSETAELLLVDGQAVVITQDPQRFDPGEVLTTVRRVDLSDPADPVVTDEQEYAAELLSARNHGSTVRLVLRTGLPALDFVEPGEDRSEREAVQENREVVRGSTLADWLPSVRDDGGDRQQLAGCESMTVPEDFSGAGSITVVGHDAASPSERDVVGVAADSTIAYSSADRLYVATREGWDAWCCELVDAWDGRGAPIAAGDGATDLHAFALDGTRATWVASGEVEGALADRWSMDSADGVLRVAVGPTEETGNFSSVVTLTEEGGRLVEAGRVDRLGVDEEIKSVRWFDDLAIVVTFRTVDPLYAIDLGDPRRPRLLGELKIPGFSEYLHPIGGDQLLGLGTDATLDGRTRGGQAAVFDIADLTDPRRVAQLSYGERRMVAAAQDPRQFTWLPDRRTALAVVWAWGRSGGTTAWVSVLEVAPDGTLTNRMERAAYGFEDARTLRTLPLPDGRVVLSAEDGASFLDL